MFSHGSRILAVIAAAVPFASVHSAQAADFAGSVQGVVKSASGQVLPGAYVKLINPERRLTFMVVSEAQGRYTMNNLPPGNYTVQGIGNGFQSKPTPVALTAGTPATADVSLTDQQADGAERMGSEPWARRRQRTGSRVGAAEPAGRGRQSDHGTEVRPMPFPVAADANAMVPRQLGEKDRLDARTHP